MTDILTPNLPLKDQNEYLIKYLRDEYGISLSSNISAIGIAVGLLEEQRKVLDGVKDLVIPKEVLTVVEDGPSNITLLNNITREASLFAKATGSYSGIHREDSKVISLLTGFIEKFGAELWPDPTYHMRGPVDEIDGHIVEAKTRKLNTRLRVRSADFLLSEREIIDVVYEQIAAEFRAEIAQLDENQTFCPYVVLTTAGVVIDPETFEPVIGFLTRYGVLTR